MDNRSDPPVMTAVGQPPGELSPTGTPWMPVKLVPALVALGGVAFAVSEFTPSYTIAHVVAAKVLTVLAIIGITSPGWRKNDGA